MLRRVDTKSRAHRIHSPVAGVIAVLMALACAACTGSKAPQAPSPPPPPVADVPLAWEEQVPGGRWNLLLLTLDTTRSDVLGCYGHPGRATPTLDSLAARGVLFEQAVTPAPITAPAHMTILTGLDPVEHGVRNNGRYIAADSLESLAEMFQRRGYETAAFLSAYPLDRRFGFDQGFALYDDTFEERIVGGGEETSQRRGDAVTDATLAWEASRSQDPFFAWVHYFDPHFTYDPPSPFGERYASDPYLGEVAFMDFQIGRLLGRMRVAGALDSTFVLVVGDHGESLGEHSEQSHSFFVYDATQLVPCILVPPERWPGAGDLRGTRIPWQVRLRDLAPTAANLMGWESQDWGNRGSTSLLPSLMHGTDPVPAAAYVESWVPYLEYGWSRLRGVRVEGWKYIRAPRPELYNLKADPRETTNVHAAEPEVVATLEAWLDAYLLREGRTEAVAMNPEVVERLRSLGYTGGGVTPAEGSGADPKDRISAYNSLNLARTLMSQFRPEEAKQLLEPLARLEPENLELLYLLGSTFVATRELGRSRTVFDRLMKESPGDDRFIQGAAQTATLEGDYSKALALLDVWQGVSQWNEDVWTLRGQIHEAQGQYREALDVYTDQRRRFPKSPVAALGAGRAQRVLGDRTGARKTLEESLAESPGFAPALSELADLAIEDGDLQRGDSLLTLALGADPFDPVANFHRGLQASRVKDIDAAREAYMKAVQANPEYAAAHNNLANVLLEAEEFWQALAGYEKALALGYESPELRTNQGVAYAQTGQIPLALQSWERALELGPDEATAAGLRQNIQRARQMIGGG